MRNEIIDVIGVFVLRIFVKRLCFENQTCRKIRYANVRIYHLSGQSRARDSSLKSKTIFNLLFASKKVDKYGPTRDFSTHSLTA